MLPNRTLKAALLLGLPVGVLLGANPILAQTAPSTNAASTNAPSTNAMINLVRLLVAQGTIEERILALQERKAALAESMYSGAQGRKEPLFSETDLQELLKPLSK